MSKKQKKEKKRDFTFLFFLAISAGLWLLIKLSEDYSTQATFSLRLENVPTDQWISSGEQTVKFSVEADGFHTLKYILIRETKRFVSIPLDKVPYRLENGTTYSFGSQYVADILSDVLDVNAANITMNEDKVYFNMEALKSKVVPVNLQSDVHTQRQYDTYGLPVVEPATVTVYGPQAVIDTLRSVKTALLSKSEANATFSENVALDLAGGLLRSETQSVKVTIEVVQFTETELEIPISVDNPESIRLFPDAVKVRFILAIKDFPTISADDFRIEVDATQADGEQTLLDVNIVKQPNHIELLAVEPQKVEYLLVE